MEAVTGVCGPAAADEARRLVLGVQWSETGRAWRQAVAAESAVEALCRRHDLPDLVGRILVERGVPVDGVDDYLTPSLRTSLPDPDVLADMPAAASVLCEAIAAGRTIGVFGDYDVDGATSTAMMVHYLRRVGCPVLFHIPDRLTEGYGPNLPAVEAMVEKGAGCIVFLDCGTLAFDVLQTLSDRGIDAIVIDHHTAEARLPASRAVVNPNRQDDTSGLTYLAACGVTFLALVALNRALRGHGAFLAPDVEEPSLLDYLDLVALGTVCDVVPLTGVNRAFVSQGLKVMNGRGNAGIAALSRIAGVNGTIDGYHAGFILGPRLNAGGRVGRADLGVRLLSGETAGEDLDAIARLLDNHNDDRKETERHVLDAAASRVPVGPDGEPLHPVVVVHGQGWHPGVIGIVAGRLKERLARPVCVIAWEIKADGTLSGVGKASARSVPGVDLGRAIIDARTAGLLVAGGGHAMAAGFTIEPDRLEAFQAFMDDHVRAQIAAAFPDAANADESPLARDYPIDSLLSAEAATAETARLVARLGPFGPGNREPRFAMPSVRIIRPRIVGAGHVSFFANGGGGASIKAIAFRSAETALGAALMESANGRPVHLAGTLRLDTWQGRESAQFLVEDAACVDRCQSVG